MLRGNLDPRNFRSPDLSSASVHLGLITIFSCSSSVAPRARRLTCGPSRSTIGSGGTFPFLSKHKDLSFNSCLYSTSVFTKRFLEHRPKWPALCTAMQATSVLTQASLSTLPHFVGDSHILSISPSLPHEISNLPHRAEEELQMKKSTCL